jgi:hypothetical protein
MEYLVQQVRNHATTQNIVIPEDDGIIIDAINNIAQEMQQGDALDDAPQGDALDDAPQLLVRDNRVNREAGAAARMNAIIAEIQRIQQERRGRVWGPEGQVPDPSESVSPPERLISYSPHPPPPPPPLQNMGGSRKIKKTKSYKKRPTARRRRRSSKAARKSRKARNARRR